MRITIKRWDNEAVIWQGEAETTRDAVEQAVEVGISLSYADLAGQDLSGTNLTRAYMTSVITDNLIPVIPQLDAKILEAIKAGGKLKMDDWHTCKTTHCRAGWAIHLAGKAGYTLEKDYGASAAGAFIYHKSVGYVPDFYASDKDAMEDIRQKAKEQG